MTETTQGREPAIGGRSHVLALDGLRGVAILAVMGFHFAFEFAPGGAFGVDLFFVLSSFLITGLLLKERARTGRIDFTGFYARRVARLYPALVVFLIAIAPPIAFALGTQDGIPISTAAVALYVADFGMAGFFPLVEPYGHTWSLAVEEQFYMIWPVTLLAILHRRVKLVPLGVVMFLAACVLTVSLSHLLGMGQNYFLPSGHLPALAAGCLAAFVSRPGAEGLIPSWLTSTGLAVAALAGFLVLTVTERQLWPPLLQDLAPIPIVLLLSGLVLHTASGANSPVNRLLQLSILRWFGTRSYGLYLYHTALYYLFQGNHVSLSRSVNTLIAVVLSLVIAELSFRYIERPITKRGAEWSRRRLRVKG